MALGFSSRLVAAREERGWTASELARRLNVTSTAVWNWEKNGVTPRPDMLTKIANALQVTEQHLLVGTAGTVEPSAKRSVADVIDQAQRDIAAIVGLPIDRVRVKVEFGSE